MTWSPELSKKQTALFNMGIKYDSELRHPNAAPAILASGARYSGKSTGVQNRILRHLWDTPGARACIVSKTIKSMTDAGGFRDMVEIEIPKWIDSGIGFEFTTRDRFGAPGPTQDSKTRTVLFKVRNRFGAGGVKGPMGESELRLLSLNHDHEVDSLFRNTSWSCIWFSEFSQFRSPRVFTTAMFQLRMRHLKKWQHLFIADTNPDEEGEDHWIYQLWYKHRYDDEAAEQDPDALEYKKSLRLLEFFLEDNPWLTDGEIKVIKSRYKSDPGQYARDVDGLWVAGHGNRGKHFADLWTPHVHVIGDDEEAFVDLLPTTQTLYAGWDIGDGTNHAIVALEQRLIKVTDIEWICWVVIAEIISIREEIHIRDLTLNFQGVMRDIEAHAGRKFEWVHWSDDTALNVHRNTGAGYDALDVQLASKGEIILQGVTKPAGSVKSRVKITRRLLRENRIWVAPRCPGVQAMFRELSQGSTLKGYVAENDHKHPFDAMTYPIFIESGNELLDEVYRPQTSRPAGRMISV